MEQLNYIKGEIEKLYQTNPDIHISVNRTRPRIFVEASPAKIVGVYKNIFQIEESVSGRLPVKHTFQYGEVLIGQVAIKELDYVPTLREVRKK